MTIDDIMRCGPVIPVLVLEEAVDSAALAAAFVDAGLRVIEVTLRTSGALDHIRRMRQVEGAIVGAGTVLDERQLGAALEAGSQFIVSPGLTRTLAAAAAKAHAPYLPGIATAGEIMRGLDLGFDRFKFFPAETSGGIAALKALAAPFADVRFCPTGGIRQATAAEWLTLDCVSCVGGTWLYRGSSDDLEAVRQRAEEARALAARAG